MEFCVKLLSLPLWERGLKSAQTVGFDFLSTSLPLWERGLKFIPGFMTAACLRRSPCGSVD